jgi:hypothetical protein
MSAIVFDVKYLKKNKIEIFFKLWEQKHFWNSFKVFSLVSLNIYILSKYKDSIVISLIVVSFKHIICIYLKIK